MCLHKNIIPESIIICCKDCGNDFRWVPNSSIKPVRCIRCQNLLDFQKSKERIEKNKKILSQATGYGKIQRSRSDEYKNTRLDKRRLKRAENAPKSKRVHWTEKPLPQLIKYVQGQICNPYIRKRDKTMFGKCISCNSGISQAGHRYSIGDFPGMRFMINNLHGQEVGCNHFKSGNINSYDRGLIARHGEEYLNDLKLAASKYLQNGSFKWFRFDVIQIGYTYQYLLDNKIWIFTMKEFNYYRDLANKLIKL